MACRVLLGVLRVEPGRQQEDLLLDLLGSGDAFRFESSIDGGCHAGEPRMGEDLVSSGAFLGIELEDMCDEGPNFLGDMVCNVVGSSLHGLLDLSSALTSEGSASV